MVYYFLEGGAFMWPILLTLIFGLAFVIERAYSLMMSGVDSQAFFDKVSKSISESGAEAAAEVCKQEQGPVSVIFQAGLSKMSRGIDEVEKAIQNAGAIEMAFLEKNMIWLNAVITIAPMLGFTGTVVGMITAFTGLTETSGANPDLLAAGISQALITTAFGLMIAVPGLVLHKYFEQKITYLLISLQKDVSEFIDVINK